MGYNSNLWGGVTVALLRSGGHDFIVCFLSAALSPVHSCVHSFRSGSMAAEV